MIKHKPRSKRKRLTAAQRRKVPNPLRLDPSRTLTLRRQFEADLKRRFKRVKQRVLDMLLVEDTLGLKPRSLVSYNGLAENESGCGAGAPGSPGFQPGNDCAREDGSGVVEKKLDVRSVASSAEFYQYLQDNADKWFLSPDKVKDLGYQYDRSSVAEKIATLEASDYPMPTPTSYKPADLKVYGEAKTEKLRLVPSTEEVRTLGIAADSIKPEDTIFVRHRTTPNWEKEFLEVGIDTRNAPADSNLGRLTTTDKGLVQSRIDVPGLYVEPNTGDGYQYGVVIQLQAKQLHLSLEAEGLGYKSAIQGFYGAKDAIVADQIIPPEQIVGVYAYEQGKPTWKPNPSNPNSSLLKVDENGHLVTSSLADNESKGTYDPADPSVINRVTENAPFHFATSAQKVAAFTRYLKQIVDVEVVADTPSTSDDWWYQYTVQGYMRGAGRAFTDVHKKDKFKGSLDFYAGTKEQFFRSSFGRPETVAKTKLLAGRVFTDLKGITGSMSAQLSRTLTDGLVQGDSPWKIARQITKDIDKIGLYRAQTIARTEIIRAHSEGQLDAMQAMGIEQVEVAVEWSTAGDERVCKLCAPLEGIILKIDEAHNMIPRHPNCRCAFLPANIGEEHEEQKLSKGAIQKAIRASVKAEIPSKQAKTVAERIGLSSWVGATKQVAKKRPEAWLG